jgi:hypothetical protein
MLPMSLARPSLAPGGLLPLPRPLMTGEVLDAAFRLFRVALLRCLPYSGLAVLVLYLPSLYATFQVPLGSSLYITIGGLVFTDQHLVFLVAMLLVVVLFGAITLRLHTVARGLKPRFRVEIATALGRWPNATLATIGALGFPLLLFGLGPMFANVLPMDALIVVSIPVLWPAALLAVGLPAFWCDRLGPFAAVAQSVRVSRRSSWRMLGAILATGSIILVFYILVVVVFAMMSPLLGRADLFMISSVSVVLTLVIGAVGVPFVLAVLVIAYEELKLRELERRGAAP